MLIRLSFILLLASSPGLMAKDFTEFPRTQAVIDTLVNEYKIEQALVIDWMSSGQYRQASVTNLAAPAEKTKSYVEYKPMFVADETIRAGQLFFKQNQKLLTKAESEYGVPSEIIVSIIGIESRYGRSKGRHITFDSLGSLAVTEGRRADYFQREWIRYIATMHKLGRDPLKMKGSYAGASGYPQFMPTSYQAYAVDHDKDGDINIWDDPNDAIGSVANYLKENGWRTGEPILSSASISDAGENIKINSFSRDRTLQDVVDAGWKIQNVFAAKDSVFPIRLDTEQGARHWVGYRNFWSISRYNRSVSYSMAVYQLAQAIKIKN